MNLPKMGPKRQNFCQGQYKCVGMRRLKGVGYIITIQEREIWDDLRLKEWNEEVEG